MKKNNMNIRFFMLYIVVIILFIMQIRGDCVQNVPSNALWVDGSRKGGIEKGTKAEPYSTINAAIKSAKAGDTIVVKGGTYRESILLISGKPGKPFTLMGMPGERVIVSGMQKIDGWKKHSGNVYVAVINWAPETIYVDYEPQKISREPNEGWWTAESVDSSGIVDSRNLSKLNKEVVGGDINVWAQKGNLPYNLSIKEFNRSKSRISMKMKTKDPMIKLTKGDKYFFKNHPSLIDRPGEWAVQEKGGKYYVYFWPEQNSHLNNVQAPKSKTPVVRIDKANNVRVIGIEVTGGAWYGIEIKNSENVEVSWSIIHNNSYIGFVVQQAKHIQIHNNISWFNSHGLSIGHASDVLISENDIGYNQVDGLILSYDSDNLTVKNNYVHDHLLWGHPDNIQLYRHVKNVRFINNLIISASQSVMLEETSKGEFIGNMVIGCRANMLIFGHNNSGDYKVYNNTLAFSGYSSFSFTAKDYDVRENILVTGHDGPIFSVKKQNKYTGDRNLFWNAEGLKNASVIVTEAGWKKASLKDFQSSTGQDKSSVYANPLFINAPVGFQSLDGKKLQLCTTSKLYLQKATAGFLKGDIVEINFDGISRRITDVDKESITISPALKEKPIRGWLVANWKNNSNFKLDLRVKGNSPAMKMSKSGGLIGSAINVQAYDRGDFNGDGKRDIPSVPKDFQRRASIKGVDE